MARESAQQRPSADTTDTTDIGPAPTGGTNTSEPGRRRPGRPPGPRVDRRAQLTAVTIELVAEEGRSAATLGRVAKRAGISKASVLHHVDSVADLLRAASDQVVAEMIEDVTTALADASPETAPAAYIESMVEHFRRHPEHTRMLTEAIVGGFDLGASHERWGPVAELLAGAREARGLQPHHDLRAAALVIGGGIDAIVDEQLRDPAFDGAGAARELSEAVDRTWLR